MLDKWIGRLGTLWGCAIIFRYAQLTAEGIRHGWDFWQFVAAYLGTVFVLVEAMAAVLVFTLIAASIYYGVIDRSAPKEKHENITQ